MPEMRCGRQRGGLSATGPGGGSSPRQREEHSIYFLSPKEIYKAAIQLYLSSMDPVRRCG